MSKSNPNAPKRLALISSKGTLDWAYPPFILASAAGAMGWEVGVFFTFYGLTLLKPELTAAVSPLGNPAIGRTLHSSLPARQARWVGKWACSLPFMVSRC